MLVQPLSPISYRPVPQAPSIRMNFDSVSIENPYINKKPFIERKIIAPDENINLFFDNISSRVFQNQFEAKEFSKLLKYGFISLSSSAYANLDEPYSAVGVQLPSDLESFIEKGQGVGINFSSSDNPIEEIKKINADFKKKEASSIRPPAGIALLDINHPKIEEFITLKDNADYSDWCFDLSVIMDDKFKDSKTYTLLLNSMLKKGEPGIIFSNNKEAIFDSCAATELKEGEGLTLGQVNLARFYNKVTGKIDYNLLKYASSALFKAMKNIDSNSYIGVLGYQDLINSLGFKYGSKEALFVLENCLKTIKETGAKMALSPTGTTSRVLNTTPSIDSKGAAVEDELKTMALAQKYLDGGISKTIVLDKDATIDDVDKIISYCRNNGIKGITVYKKT